MGWEKLDKSLAVHVFCFKMNVSFSELEEANKSLEDMIKSAQAKLQSSVIDLEIDEDKKNRLIDIACNDVIKGTVPSY